MSHTRGWHLEKAKIGPCMGGGYKDGTKQPTDNPSQYEEFTAECLSCGQRIGLVVGFDHLKMHESHKTWARKWAKGSSCYR